MSVRQPGDRRRSFTISRRGRILALVAVILIVLVQVVPRLNSVFTDWLWFSSVGATGVMRTELVTRAVLFLVVGVLVGAAVAAAAVLAYRYRPVYLPAAASGAPDVLARYRAVLAPTRRGPIVWIAVVAGLLAGLVAQSTWKASLAFLHSTPFGRQDPEFGLDISFYAFELPFWRMVATSLMAAVVLAFLTSVVTHYVFGGIRPGAREGLLTRAALVQLSTLAGLFVLLKAAAYWLDRYELLFHKSSTFTGAGYTDVNAVIPAKLFMFAVALVCAAAFFSAIVLRDLRIPALATVLLVFSAVVVGSIWPLALEQFSVKPNRVSKEREYIARNIEATRAAYGIGDDQVTYEENWGSKTPDPKRASTDQATLSNIRVLDPDVLSPTFTQEQQLKNFYGFPETLNVDRYDVDGQKRDQVVAAREIDSRALQGNQLDWVNRHTLYTHGNGFVSAPANKINRVNTETGADDAGMPVWQVSDIGTGSDPETKKGEKIPVDQPRIYFGELIADSDADYAITGTGDEPREYDTDSAKYSYTGSGGVPIGNWVNRTAFALKYGERNILLSGLINDKSRILFDRDPRDRVQKVAPWLTTDSSTYPAVVDGRIKWIVDGYTTLSTYPYAELSSLGDTTRDSTTGRATREQGDDKASYIRNSVKATVDAYDGTVDLYQFDENDPVLKTWSAAFPGTVHPKSDISPDLMQHFRYPKDLFKVQRELLTRYHVDDPTQFFGNDSFWSVPTDPTGAQNAPTTSAAPTTTTQPAAPAPAAGGTPAPAQAGSQPPYYVMASDPKTGRAGFQLVSTFLGYSREFLAAYMTASSDPATYGRITIREQGPELQAQGPGQGQGAIDRSPQVSSMKKNMEATAKVIDGNLLPLALADGSVLYVQPLYAQRNTGANPYPALLRVVVVYRGRVGYAPTVYEALKQVGIQADPNDTKTAESGATTVPAMGSGSQPATSSSAPQAPAPSAGAASGGVEGAVGRLDTALGKVRAAQQGGDLSTLGTALDELQKAVDEYQKASGQKTGG